MIQLCSEIFEKINQNKKINLHCVLAFIASVNDADRVHIDGEEEEEEPASLSVNGQKESLVDMFTKAPTLSPIS